jgi:hypothetical protein
MPFKKNNTLGRGRPKNAINKNSYETKTLLHNIVGNQLDEVESLLSTLEPKDKLEIIIKLLPYVLPRQSEIAIESKEEEERFNPITVNLINPDNGKEKNT